MKLSPPSAASAVAISPAVSGRSIRSRSPASPAGSGSGRVGREHDPHPRVALAGHDVGHDLSGLQAAVARAKAGVVLEKLQQREIQVLVQRLARAHDLVVPVQRELDAGDFDRDLQHVEIGRRGSPGMAGHRLHHRTEHRFVLGFHRPVARGHGLAFSPGANPAARDQLAIGADAVRRKHLETVHPVGHGRRVFFEVEPDALQQAGQRIRFQPKAVRRCREGDGCAVLPDTDLAEQGMHQRLVGAADAGEHAQPGQLLGCRIAGVLVLEHPELDLAAVPLGGGELDHQRVERARDSHVEQHMVHQALPAGSSRSRSQSPSRLRPSTVTMIASPGNTLTHHAVWR